MELIDRIQLYDKLRIGRTCGTCYHKEECDTPYAQPQYTMQEVCEFISEEPEVSDKLTCKEMSMCEYAYDKAKSTAIKNIREEFCKNCVLYADDPDCKYCSTGSCIDVIEKS